MQIVFWLFDFVCVCLTVCLPAAGAYRRLCEDGPISVIGKLAMAGNCTHLFSLFLDPMVYFSFASSSNKYCVSVFMPETI